MLRIEQLAQNCRSLMTPEESAKGLDSPIERMLVHLHFRANVVAGTDPIQVCLDMVNGTTDVNMLRTFGGMTLFHFNPPLCTAFAFCYLYIFRSLLSVLVVQFLGFYDANFGMRVFNLLFER